MVKKTETGRELGLAIHHSVAVPEASPVYFAAIGVAVGGQKIGTAEEPVLDRAIELAGAQSWGDG